MPLRREKNEAVLRTRALRRDMTLPEGMLCGRSCGSGPPGSNFVVSIRSAGAWSISIVRLRKVVIEVDGESHSMGDHPATRHAPGSMASGPGPARRSIFGDERHAVTWNRCSPRSFANVGPELPLHHAALRLHGSPPRRFAVGRNWLLATPQARRGRGRCRLSCGRLSSRGLASGGIRPKLTFIGWKVSASAPPVMWPSRAPSAVSTGGGGRLLAAQLGGGEAGGEDADGGAFDIAFAAGDLAGEADVGLRLQAKFAVQQPGRIDEAVAVDAAEPRELGIFEAGDGAEDADLLAMLQLGLEADHVPQGAERIVLAQLDDGIGPAAGARIVEADAASSGRSARSRARARPSPRSACSLRNRACPSPTP